MSFHRLLLQVVVVLVFCSSNAAGKFICSCKGFCHVGICSHVMVVNHWLESIDVLQLVGSICPEKRRKGGFNKGCRPALVKEKQSKKQRLK